MVPRYACFLIVTILVAGCSRESPDETKRKALVGTWSGEHKVSHIRSTRTLQSDGTFVLKSNAISGIVGCFVQNVQMSGTWKVKDGEIVSLYTESANTPGPLGKFLDPTPAIGSEESAEIVEIVTDRFVTKSGDQDPQTWYRVR